MKYILWKKLCDGSCEFSSEIPNASEIMETSPNSSADATDKTSMQKQTANKQEKNRIKAKTI